MDNINLQQQIIQQIEQLNEEHQKNINNLINTLFDKHNKPNLFNRQTAEQKQELHKKLLDYIFEFEGLSLTVYTDTENNLTIGYAHKLTKKEINQKVFKISQAEAEEYLNKDIENALKLAKNIYPNYDQHRPNIRLFMILQCFNMGNNLRSFKNSNPALINFDYNKAYIGFKKSKWCKQVKSNRCNKTLQLLKEKQR